MMRQSAAVLGCLAAMLGSTAAGGPNCKERHVWAKNSTGEGAYCSAYPELIPASTHLTNNWGWNNWVEADVTAVTLDLWAGATGCDTAQGELVGTLDVTYDGKDATVTFLPAPGVTFTMYNVYLGCPKWYVQPANGEITNQFAKLPLGGGPGPHVYDVGSHGFYVQAHAKEEVCAECVDGEHVWARNSTGEGCFLDYPELPTATWGWTNWITQGTAETTLTLYAKAWNCNIGLWNDVVGTVVVTYDDDKVEYEFFPATGVTFSEYDVYISCNKWQKKPSQELTVNPNFFHNKEYKATVSWIGPHGFYVQAHAKRSCPTDPPVGSAPGGPVSQAPRPLLNSGLCPITMTVNGSTILFSENDCTCSKFSCDSPTAPWTTRNMRFCNRCPAFLEDSYHFSCPHCASAGTEVTFKCPSQWEACDVFVQAHIQCATKDTDGGLGYNLASDGWVAGSCGPQFCLPFEATCQNGTNPAVVQEPKQKIAWNMPLFHKQFAGGEDMEIPQFATEPTMYFTFFVREGHFCSNDKNETECAMQPSVCAWDASLADSCHASLCPGQDLKPPGGPCCDVASGVDSKQCFRPEVEITRPCHFILPECDQPGEVPQ